jgi:signal transduction histidine kinase/HPt (histidine-containing phosphotransfer) domain-containing protein/ActR/RegA family two-component response regulator
MVIKNEKKIGLGEVVRKDFLQLLFVILAFSLMVAVSYFFVDNIIKKQIFNHAKAMLQTAETAIRSDMREAEVSLLNISLFVEDGMDSGWSPEDLRNYLIWQNTALIPKETGIPGFFNIFCYIDGRFISARRNWDPPADYDPHSRSWFVSAEKAAGKVGYSSPYTDLITGEHVLSLTRRMDKEEKPWFIGIDLHIDPLFDYVSTLQYGDGGYGLLMDQDFTVLVHPNDDFLNIPVEKISEYHVELVRNLKTNPQGVIIQQMPNWKGVMMVLVSKRLFNGWYLSIATPVDRYYGDSRSMAIVLSILGLGFMNVLCIFLIRLSLLKARSDMENREKTSFLAKMSHEIRTPMNSILGMTELIQRKMVSSEIQEYINILYQSGQNLLSIINDILDFSRIESNRLQIEKRNYHIASIINDIINVIRPRATEKSLDFFVRVDAKFPAQLVGDDMRIRQILTNLLSNAVKYTRKGFISLDIGIKQRENNKLTLICTVTDSGIGIKQEDMGQLFSDFSRLDAKVNQGIEGTGLGLVITKALCQAMGGDVTVSSEYGNGSVFQATVVQEIEHDKPAAQVVNPEQKRVLFFDWRPLYVQSITGTFRSLGINPDRAPDFESFKQSLETGDYDHAFISSKYAMDCIYILGKRKVPIQLVIMVELGEVSVFREVSSIMMPVYSVPLANIFNNKADETMLPHSNAKLKIRFTAPEAKILLVDDISTNLKVAKELMNPYNMNIHTCLSGAEAVELVKQNRYDIVFMDHMMPEMDGIEATAHIRAMEHKKAHVRKLPIIALTANAVTGQREMFLQNDIDDFLAKPIDIQKLDEILEKWLPKEKQIGITSPIQDDSRPGTREIAIPGINAEIGLCNMGGSPDIYFDILADFCRDAESGADRITDALNNGDTKLYITLVHAMKGASRSIGAMETGELAAWLEKAAEEENADNIRNKTIELLENVRVLVSNIRAAIINRETDKGQTKGDVSALHLDTLKTALAEMNIEEVNKILLEYASLALDSETKGKIAEVEQFILMFEYEKAVEKINELF